jgi:hypothetical protein
MEARFVSVDITNNELCATTTITEKHLLTISSHERWVESFPQQIALVVVDFPERG